MISARGLTKYYGTTRAIDDVSFQVEQGEILGFLGPNAAGKTTTMRILTCYTPPTSGTATVAGYDVLKNSLEVRRQIGYMPETVPVYPDMTVRSYLEFIAEAKAVPRPKKKQTIDSVIEEVGLDEVQHRLNANLSKGFRQRVGLAQALLGKPKVLILDEPTIGLDPKQIIEIRRLIKSLAGRHTVILSTHILPEVSMTCSRVAIINEGKIVAQGTPEHLISELQTTMQSRALVEGDLDRIRTALQSVGEVKKVTLVHKEHERRGEFLIEYEKGKDLRGQITRALFESGATLLEFNTMGMSLEDIFVKVVTAEEVTHHDVA